MANPLRQLMPAIFQHQGVWQGTYRHIDVDGNTLDFHHSKVECIFPESGDAVYVQRNQFDWADGRQYSAEFAAVLNGDKLFWDTDRFCGYGWQASPHMFYLELQRKDEPGVSFYENIIIGDDPGQRARTWHWFKQGKCFKRTLCDESLVTAL